MHATIIRGEAGPCNAKGAGRLPYERRTTPTEATLDGYEKRELDYCL